MSSRSQKKSGYSLVALPAFVMLLLSMGYACHFSLKEVPNHQSGKKDRKADIVITIVYDNYPFDERLEESWGFSCVITGLSETILFDTGGDGDVLVSNMAKLGIKPQQIDKVVLSHIHGDHTGGLDGFLRENSKVAVYMPKAFPRSFKESVKKSGATVVECEGLHRVCDKAWTTGVLCNGIHEQGLYLETPKGLIVISGCAHPGIVRIAKAAKNHAETPVYAVLGGFHMAAASDREIENVMQGLRKLGVEKIAPCHCSGDRTRSLMNQAFEEGYLSAGVGARLVFQFDTEEPD